MLVPLMSACGGSGDSATSTPAQGDAASRDSPAAEPVEKAHVGGWPELRRVAGRYADRLVIPRGPAPQQVVIRDLKVGNGPIIERGDSYWARYMSIGFATGKVFESLWRKPTPGYSFGRGLQREGWEVGLKGIREGGVREMIVPSRMAYKNGALVYVVQVLKLG